MYHGNVQESDAPLGLFTGIFPVNRQKYPKDRFNPSQLEAYLCENRSTLIPDAPPQSQPVPLSQQVRVSAASDSQQSSSCATTSATLHDFFMTTFNQRSAPRSEAAVKRRRIQTESAVITHAEYTDAIAELDR
jgi:hypothetical protein